MLALGGIEPRKGSIDLLEAYAPLCRRRPDLKLFGGGETLFDYREYRRDFERRRSSCRSTTRCWASSTRATFLLAAEASVLIS